MSFHYFSLSVWASDYRRQTKLRGGNVFTPVCDSVHGGCLCPGVSLSGGSLSKGVSVEGVSVDGVSVRETPPYGKEQAVRILLECILV